MFGCMFGWACRITIPRLVDWKLSALSQLQEGDIYRLTVKFYFAYLFLILEGVIRCLFV
jgi:hypothetical protein